jgi:threonine dehydrogenase-like Zn-dependent dehydrogenase
LWKERSLEKTRSEKEMKAVVYGGPNEVRVEDVPEPRVIDPEDAVVAVETTAICGSDLHVVAGKTPGMRIGGVLGHEYVGVVRDAGPDVARHRPGDRVLGSFLISCGVCGACTRGRFNFCSRRRALGLGELSGNLDGAQAEFVRVPSADLNLRSLGPRVDNDRAVFCGDILATGFYAAALAEIDSSKSVLVMGAGPVGLCCALAVRRLGPQRLLICDADETRTAFARSRLGFDVVDASSQDTPEAVAGWTDGAMADVVIEAVGAVPALKTALRCARDGGQIVVVGVYGKERYDLPMGVAWIRGLDLRFSGMANVHAHWGDALEAVARNEIDPTSLITHRLPLDQAPQGYELFRERRALKVLMTP